MAVSRTSAVRETALLTLECGLIYCHTRPRTAAATRMLESWRRGDSAERNPDMGFQDLLRLQAQPSTGSLYIL